MKKSFSIAFVLSFLITGTLLAQLEGAVGFKTAEKNVQPPSQIVSETQEDAVLAQEKLVKRISKTHIWNNPRFVKMYYGRLKGIQNSIEKEQEKQLEEKSFETEEEKQKALDEMKSQALISFDDYQEDAKLVQEKMNTDPKAALVDMASRTNYIESEKMTPAYTESTKEQMADIFENKNGVTMDAYQAAFVGQLKDEKSQREQEKDKATSFPPMTDAQSLEVEKIDDQSALLRLTVGAPKTDKN